jgi:HK97 family phage prohead protease
MKTNEIHRTATSDLGEKTLQTGTDGAALREGILAEFTGTLTTKSEDRDGDILESKGANLDPRMPLLFNHSTAHPVGKFLSVVSRDNDGVVGKFAIVDSDLGRDVLKLIKIGALRLSIGFKPSEFEPRKGGKGFLVKAFEIVETSLVAVPSNREAIISALQEGKFHQPEFVKSLTTEDVPMPKPTTPTTPILNASGVAAPNSENNTTGPPTLADYETLLFAIGKQYRSAAQRCCFISNDTSYRRRTSIRIDSNADPVDQRPVFGMSHNDYMTLGWPHKIQNDIVISQVAFGALAKYRMFRRMGMSLE